MVQEEYITKSYFEAALESRFSKFEERMDAKLDAKLDAKFDAFARLIQGEFQRIDERFRAVDERFDDLEGRMNKRFDSLEARFDKLEFVVLGDHEKRIEKLEDTSRIVKTKLSIA